MRNGTQLAVSSIRVIDPEMLEAAVRDADLEPCQLGSGAGSSLLERVECPRICLDLVAVAPAINIPLVPAVATHVFRNVAHKLPNVSLPSAGSQLDHAYAGQTTKGLDATFGMAAYVADSAYEDPPAAGDDSAVIKRITPSVGRSCLITRCPA